MSVKFWQSPRKFWAAYDPESMIVFNSKDLHPILKPVRLVWKGWGVGVGSALPVYISSTPYMHISYDVI